MTLREEADKIIKEAITKVLPDEAVKQALKNRKPVKGKLYQQLYLPSAGCEDTGAGSGRPEKRI